MNAATACDVPRNRWPAASRGSLWHVAAADGVDVDAAVVAGGDAAADGVAGGDAANDAAADGVHDAASWHPPNCCYTHSVQLHPHPLQANRSTVACHSDAAGCLRIANSD